MALAVGSRLGPYDVTALIGEGGIGQVLQRSSDMSLSPGALKGRPQAPGLTPPSYAAVERDKDAGICHTLAGVVVGRMEAIESFIFALASFQRSTRLGGFRHA